MVEELAPSAGSEVGSDDRVIEATGPDVPIVTNVACVTFPDSHVMSAKPDVVPAISDTTTLPGIPEICDGTVMVCKLFAK